MASQLLMLFRSRTFLHYIVVGSSLAAIYLGLSFGLHSMASMPAHLASPIAFLLSVPIAYFAQSILVFRAGWLDGRQFLRFLVTMGVGFVVSASTIPILSWALGLPEIIAMASVSAFVPLVNFVVFRFWVFE